MYHLPNVQNVSIGTYSFPLWSPKPYGQYTIGTLLRLAQPSVYEENVNWDIFNVLIFTCLNYEEKTRLICNIKDQRMDALHLIHIGIDYISLDTIPSVRWCMLSSM